MVSNPAVLSAAPLPGGTVVAQGPVGADIVYQPKDPRLLCGSILFVAMLLALWQVGAPVEHGETLQIIMGLFRR